ncbi:gliding motility-associated C-terminal domain-containing protein [Sanyastnella coralliicola]|uniref:T9SS type B sorting domain-containing protein n=1 Tax=Sanyastnella coralliicola TaxID=3069118 RepID=UPI0027BAC735|nr:gliding motility-associated C-terminal domain-containing protein [Longitalea sp. SCSIO 12813]
MRVIKHLLGVCLLFAALQVSANHILGGNITYTCLGGDNYGVTLTIYKDCFGSTPATLQEDVFFIPDGCTLPFSIPLPLQTETEISDLCASEIANSSCSGGFIPGAQQLTYYAEVTLDSGCSWEASWAAGDWNYFINMDNGMLPTAYFLTTIDPTQGCNDSITPDNEFPIPYVCAGDPLSYTLEFLNPGGYTLDYTLVCPQTTGGVDAPMISACNEPIAGMTFDDVTGTFTATAPGLFGNYAATVQVDMIDGGGNIIGTVIHTFAFTVRACDATPTIFTAPEIQAVSDDIVQVNATEVDACVGDSLSITVEATNANIFRTITLSSDFETLYPGGTFTQTGINPAEGELFVVVDESMIGTNVVTVDAIDDACINPTSDQIQLTINVDPSLNLNVPDTLICFGESVNIEATGDSDYTWNVLSGDPDLGLVGNGGSQTVTPDVATQIEITANNAGAGCTATEILNIDVAISDLTAVITNESCIGNDGQIDVSIAGSAGPYEYSWPDIPSVAQDLTGLVGGDYTLNVTDLGLAGCSRDTIFTLTTAPQPSGSISGDITICEGDCADILFTMAGTAPFDVELRNTNTNTLEAVPAVNDGDTFEVCPLVTTTYTLELIEDSNTPQCEYTIPSSVTVTVRPTVTATFLDPGSICAGDDVDLEVDINQAGNYEVTYSPNDGNPMSPVVLSDGDVINVSPPVTTNYSITQVQYTDAPNCPNTTVSAFQVQVDPLPTATLSGSTTICEGDAVSLTIDLTGTGPWEVTHDYAGDASPLIIVATPFTWNLANSPATTTTINLTGVTDTGTNCSQAVTSDVTITVNALPSASVLSDATICSDVTQNMEFDLVGPGPFDVIWNAGAGSTNAVGIDDGFVVAIDPVGNTNVCIESVTDANGCVNTTLSCATLTEIPLAEAYLTDANAAICANDCYDIAFTFNQGTGPYEFEVTETDDNGAVNNTIQLNAGDTYQVCPVGDYNLTITSVTDLGTGCSADFANGTTIDIAVTPISTIAISGDADICDGDCGDLTFTFTDVQGPVTFDLNGVTVGPLVDGVDIIGGVYTIQECPIATTTYTVTNYVDAATVCSDIAVGEDAATLTVISLPDASFVSDVEICEGVDPFELEFAVTNGPLDIDVEFDDGVNTTTQTVVGVNDGDLFPIDNTIGGTYTITFVTDNGMPTTCTSNPDASAVATVFTSPVVNNIDTLCANTGDTWEITFDITSGDPATYAIDIPGTLTDQGGGLWSFVSDPLIPEDGANVTINDVNNCNPFNFTLDPFTCPILTDAGTVDEDLITICDSGVLTASPNGDEILDGNDVLSFVIHDSPDENLGIVYYISDTPSWDVTADLDVPGVLQYGVTYYVSAVAGDDDGAGTVDLGAPGVDISVGVPFVIVETPTATLSGGATICEGLTTDLQVDFTGTGDYTIQLALDGVELANSPFGPTADNPFIIPVGDAGSYTLLNVSNEFCPGTVAGQADVIVNPEPTATLSGGGTFCAGGSLDLTLDLTGTPNWDVTIVNDNDNDGVIDFSEVINVGATQTTYTVNDSLLWFVDTVTDGNGCINDTDSNVETVEIDPLPTATFAFADTSFCTGTNIDLVVDLTGAAPYDVTYSLDGVPTTLTIAASPMVLNINTLGQYCIDEVLDANGCQSFPAVCIQVTEIPIPIADAGADAVFCTGDVQFIGAPAVAGYEYAWNNTDNLNDTTLSAPQVTLTNDGMVPIILDIEVIVTEGFCSATDQTQVTINPLPQAEAGDSTLICFGDAVTLNATGGDTYLWETSPAFTQGGEDTFNPTVEPPSSQWFVVNVTDANLCSAEDSVWVNVPQDFVLAQSFTNEICFGICDGNIELAIGGSYPPYTYAWDEVADTTPMIDGLCPGDYNYTITDSIGCQFTGLVTIAEDEEYFLDDVIITPPTCFGDETGVMDVESATAVNFTCEPTGETNNLGIFTNLPAGTYDVFATDANGCIADSTVTLTELSAEITMDLNILDLVVCFEDEVNLLANAEGGDGTFTYTWYGDLPPTDELSTDNPYITNVTEDLTAYVVALDGNGCSSDTLLSNITLNTPISLEVGPADVIEICEGECVDLFANAEGGSGPLQIDWVETSITGDVISNLPNVNDCPPDVNEVIYEVTVTDGCAQPAIDSIIVNIFEVPVPDFSFDVESGCFPVTVTFTNETDDSFFGDCTWNLGNDDVQDICGDIVYTYATPGEYFPSLTVTAPSGCVGTTVSDSAIYVYDYPIADFFYEPFPLTTLENELDFVNASDNAQFFEWNFAGLGTSIEANPSFTFPPLDLAVWEVCLIATSEFGCPDTVCKDITSESELLVYVPNAFTPDQDGINEVFLPVFGGGVVFDDEYEFAIFDRWGDKVFTTNDPAIGWVGNLDAGGYFVQNDVYVWRVVVRSVETGELVEFEGHVTILR